MKYRSSIIIISFTIFLALLPISLAQIQSHPLSQITPIDVNLDMYQKNIVNVSNLGIGITNPAYNLHVIGNAYISNDLVLAGDLNLQNNLLLNAKLGSNLDANSYSIIGSNWINTTNVNIDNQLCLGGICKTSWPQGSVSPWDNSTEQIFVKDGYPLFVNVSNTLFVNGTSGNVGIGTLYPVAKLDVNGSLIVRENSNIQGELDIFGNLKMNKCNVTNVTLLNSTLLNASKLCMVDPQGDIYCWNYLPWITMSETRVAIGKDSYAGDSSVAVGWGAKGGMYGATDAIAIGNGADASTTYSIAIGPGSSAGYSNEDIGAIAIGYNTDVIGEYGIALGAHTWASTYSIGIGYHSQASASHSIAIGYYSSISSSSYSVAIGDSAKVEGHDYAFVFGRGTVSGTSNEFVIGNPTYPMKVGIMTNVPMAMLDIYVPQNTNGLVINSSFVNDSYYLLNLSSNGTTQMIVTSSGRVGIGTTNPEHKLTVIGDVNATGFVKGSQICIGNDCKTSWSDISDQSGWIDEGTYVRLATSTDKVIIGTNYEPQQTLEVVGSLNVTENIYEGNQLLSDKYVPQTRRINTGTGLSGGSDLTSDLTLSIDTSLVPQKSVDEDISGIWNFVNGLKVKGGYESGGLTIDQNGNILTHGNLTYSGYTYVINTLEINGTGNFPFGLNVGGTYEGTGYNGFINFNSSNGQVKGRIYTDGNNLVIDTDSYGGNLSIEGNVGIGTTSPDSKLHVIGGVCIEDSDSECTQSPGDLKVSGAITANTVSASTLSGNLECTGCVGSTEIADSSVTANDLANPLGGDLNVSGNSVYAAIYYDSDNTAYYLDPSNTGTSALFAGKVGIGTTVISKTLDVNGNISAQGIYLNKGVAEGSIYFVDTIQGYNDLKFKLGANSNFQFQDSAGNTKASIDYRGNAQFNGNITLGSGNYNQINIIKGLRLYYTGDDTEVSTTSNSWTTVKQTRIYLDSDYGIKPRYLTFIASIWDDDGTGAAYFRVCVNGTSTGECSGSLSTSNTGETFVQGSVDVSRLAEGVYDLNIEIYTTSGTAYQRYIDIYYVL